MSSASKTLELLSFFSITRPEIGLSQLCRLAAWDKATTYRRLQALEQVGFVEQNPLTKRYRLGPALLHLAHTREVTVPQIAGADSPLRDLANATGETCHVSVLSGKTLYPLATVESPQHSIRVIIDIPTFPLHATASGLCALAFGPDALTHVPAAAMIQYTEHTAICAKTLHRAIETTKISGFGQANGTFEPDVCSLAAPLFDYTGLFAGAISVATVASRFTPEHKRLTQQQLVIASQQITHNWGGTVPDTIKQAWARVLATPQETASNS